MADHLTANGEEMGVYNLQCIDLSNPDIHESAALLRKACMESGIFYVINHGISQEFMDETFAQFKRFFDLPIEEKMKLVWNKNLRGYRPPIQAVIDDKTKQKDFSEAFHIGVEVSEDDPNAHDFFYGPNLWPPADLLPGWRKAMEKYHQEATNVARKIGRVIAVALDLNEDFFVQPELIGSANANYTNMFHYGVHGANLLKDVVGTTPHCDLNLFTLLATDDIWGLQICREKNAESQVWEAIAPVKGAYIVNVGDMLEMLTNGIFRSILHRVVFNQERYSTGTFICPNHDYIIKCLPTCTSEENPPKYPTMRTGQYIYNRFNQLSASTVGKKA
ncbi:2-oxoglutarate (2OG) and Fe(II)-dependent oxygenase superfamily protein [Melia azedarach]|uniref:Azadirone synthase LFS n=2 Tax=Melia azedarach TaxID=155640 RepID=LFS_MELAZ|nr:2-oxoglutarate (2OG) and Fe(II)-dependent oxygenase superfamily protein [Melia azedarach]WBW48729.1 LFS [Melia azedarach]